jgi:PAS domain S-box-containing protein
MKIRTKLIILFIGIALIPLLFITSLIFINCQTQIKNDRFKDLKTISALKMAQIELIFNDLKTNIIIAQEYWNIKQNLPLIEKYFNNRSNPAYLAAKNTLDGQLVVAQKNWRLLDIELINLRGIVVYCSNPKHYASELGRPSPEIDKATLLSGKKQISISDVFRDQVEDNKLAMTITAPAYDSKNKIIGVIALVVDLNPIYQLIQEPTGLGETGETLIVKKVGDEIVFLNPLRFDPHAALIRKSHIGEQMSQPAQLAVQGKGGIGLMVDYRGHEVLARWDYLPTPGWGIVTKIDTREVFSDISSLLVLTIILMLITGVVIVILSISTAQAITAPIFNLQQGAVRIGGGDLGYRVGTAENDEIGDLSRAFDQMTENLKVTTVSRDEFRKAEAWLSAVIKSVGDGMIVTDNQGHVVFVNPVAEALMGWKQAEAKDLPLEDVFNIVNEETGLKVENPVAKAIREGCVVGLANHTILITKDGTRRPIDDSAAPIKDERDNCCIGVVLIFRDVTERRLAEKKNLEAMQAKSAFTSMVSHELRTPLSAIKESVALILEGAVGSISQEQAKFLVVAKNNIDRLARMLNEVLDFQALESGKMSFKIELNDLNEVVRGVRESMLPIAEKKKLAFTLKLGESLPPVKFDRDKIIQVLTNLVNNSLKLTEQGGLTISTYVKNNFVQVAVQDTGPGIMAEDIPNLFHQYQQLERKVGGTGLGLAISQEIIKAHGGGIWVESTFGQGATFYFTLPIKEKGSV